MCVCVCGCGCGCGCVSMCLCVCVYAFTPFSYSLCVDFTSSFVAFDQFCLLLRFSSTSLVRFLPSYRISSLPPFLPLGWFLVPSLFKVTVVKSILGTLSTANQLGILRTPLSYLLPSFLPSLSLFLLFPLSFPFRSLPLTIFFTLPQLPFRKSSHSIPFLHSFSCCMLFYA